MSWSDLGRMGGPELAVLVLFAVVPAALMLWQARRAAGGDVLEVWASSHFLTVPAEQRDLVEGHLRRMVWARGIGAAVGWSIGSLTRVPGGPWGGVLVGYIVSAIVGELTAQRHLGAGVASLTPRRLEAYVPPPAIAAARGVAGATLILSTVPFLVERHRDFAGRSDAGTVGLAVATVAVAGLGEWVSRRIVARRQTAGTADLLAVDDALRSTSAHLLLASVLAAELLGLSAVAWRVGAAVAPAAVRWPALLLGFGAFVGAVATLHLLASRPWRVHRGLARPAV